MKRILYLDNFRGFQETFIPIVDVNFLVGENSTGKSSVLAMLELFSSPAFSFEPGFNFDNVKLGQFLDIVSVCSLDKSNIRVGIHIESDDKNGSKNFLWTFVEDEGNTDLKLFQFTDNKQQYTLKFTKNSVFGRKSEFDISMPPNELFTIWKTELKAGTRGFKKLTVENELPLKFIVTIAVDILSDKNSSEKKAVYDIRPFPRLTSLAPIRSKPKRTYDDFTQSYSSEGEHTPYLIKFLSEKKYKKSDEQFESFVQRIGANSSLFSNLSTTPFSKKKNSPFELSVILNEKPINIEHVGYGVSQILPLIVEIFARPKETWFSLQQPEVHLHPKAQAALGDFFLEFAQKKNSKFVIETHSDYTINRFRLAKKKSDQADFDSQILFFERENDQNKVHTIKIDKHGKLGDQPTSYREFFIQEEIDQLDI